MASAQQRLNDIEIEEQERQRHDTQLNEFQQMFEKVENDNADPIEVDDKVQATEDNIDETITTLQTQRESLTEDFDNIKDEIGEDEMKKFFKEFPYFKELFDTIVRLEEINKKLFDWRTYQYTMCNDSKNMLYNKILDYRDDEVDIEAAKRMKEMADDKVDNIKDILETMLDGYQQEIQDKVEAEVSKNMSEQNVKITSVQKDMEYLKKEQADLLTKLAESLEEVAEMTDTEKVRQAIEKNKKEVEQASRQIEDRDERMEEKKQELKKSQSDKENSENVSDEEELENESEEPEEEQEKPQFELALLASSELRKEFQRMSEEIPEEDKDIESLVEYVDADESGLRRKLENTREKYDGEDILPSVST